MSAHRGHLRVFLGMAAGVGKTFRMLLDGHSEQEAGRDVVIGLLETHRRVDTAKLAEGLPILPRRRVEYRGTMLEEMDLPGILLRAPELCLIDELAHTNVPGVEHHKRYEDVEDVLASGIDVLSTVNVQHLESLNDQVTELSGIRVRETIPDEVLGRADEIVLVDLTPEELLDRLRAGKVYPRRAHRRRAEQLLSDREPPGAARGGAAPGRRGGRAQAPGHERAGRAHATRRCPPTRRRRSASGCWRWSSRTRARNASCGEPGARRSASAPTSICSGSSPRAAWTTSRIAR